MAFAAKESPAWALFMFSFFGKIANGVAYGIGISMGFAIWVLLKRLFRVALFGGGVMAALHGIGVPMGSMSDLTAWFQQFLHSGGMNVFGAFLRP